MTFLYVTLWVVVALVGLPLLAYLMVKLGTAGYLRARQRFEQDSKNLTKGERANGNS